MLWSYVISKPTAEKPGLLLTLTGTVMDSPRVRFVLEPMVKISESGVVLANTYAPPTDDSAVTATNKHAIIFINSFFILNAPRTFWYALFYKILRYCQ
jgi:hypothetical protein